LSDGIGIRQNDARFNVLMIEQLIADPQMRDVFFRWPAFAGSRSRVRAL
jgi:hypothetical protein